MYFFPVQNETQNTPILAPQPPIRPQKSKVEKNISSYICAGVVFEHISVPHLVTTVILNHFKPTNKKLDPNVMWSDIRGSGWGSVVGKS